MPIPMKQRRGENAYNQNFLGEPEREGEREEEDEKKKKK
jgi:hypothetical protein